MINGIGGLPAFNRRRLEQPGEEVIEKVWTYDRDGDTPESGGSHNGS